MKFRFDNMEFPELKFIFSFFTFFRFFFNIILSKKDRDLIQFPFQNPVYIPGVDFGSLCLSQSRFADRWNHR